MEILLRAAITFPAHVSVAFDRFAPLIDTQPRRPLAATGFEFAIGVEPKMHKAWITDLDQLKNIENVVGLPFSGFFIDLFADPDEQLARAVMANADHPEKREFCESLVAAFEQVHDGFVDFARNDAGQFWLPRRKSSNGPLHDRLRRYDARVLVPEGWQFISVSAHEPAEISGELRNGITSEQWAKFLDRIEQAGVFRPSHGYKRMLANAFSHLLSHDLRAAIVEAVAAWEMVIATMAPRVIARSAAGYSVDQWSHHIQKVGLRGSTALLFALVTKPPIESLAAEVINAIEIRNSVIHSGANKLDASAVDVALRAIRTTAAAFEMELSAATV